MMNTMTAQVRPKKAKPPSETNYIPDELPELIPDHEQEGDSDENIRLLAFHIAKHFVRRDGKFYMISAPGSAISATDLKRVAYQQVIGAFPHISMTDELWAAVCKRAINDTHSDRHQSVAVWNGAQACRPEVKDRLVFENSMASINTWGVPNYRNMDIQEADTAMFDLFLEKIFPQAADRVVLKDWLSWCLQNEADKPTWSLLLYSQSKGTGKSTLGRLLALLFGGANSMPLNGVSKLTGRFNKTVLTRKFIACEEVKLKAGTDAGNTIKALISEKELAVEGKGTNTESINNVSVFVMTTNHYPHWIEPDDRRFYVIDVNHPGHASGPDSAEFQDFMREFYDYTDEPANIAKLYNALMQHQPSNSFDPRSLNVAAIDTPLMKSICQASGEVLQQVLAEAILKTGLYAISQADLIKIFNVELRANVNRIGHMMNELGWRSQQCKWGGVDYGRVLWVHPQYNVANGRVVGPEDYDKPVDAVEDEVEFV